ncbi:MAG: glycosyltransferase [Patescibacteria group bacterium]
MIGTDRNIFKEGSEARNRMVEYGTIVDELHIVVFSKRNDQILNQKIKISNNSFVYSTHSSSRFLYMLDAKRIAEGVIENWDLKIGNFVITAQDPFETGLVGWLVARRYTLPLQLQIHTDFLSPYFAHESLLNRVRVFCAKFLLPRASCVRVVSERIKESLKNDRLKTTPAVLPIFVDAEAICRAPVRTDLHAQYPQFDFITLMASRLTKEKNIPLAVDAIREVVKKHPKAGLIIVGGGPEKERLKLLATRYSLLANIVFEPWTDDLVSYYKTADVFLLTSNYEGYGRTVVEALAAGCPVVMTDTGVAGDIVKNNENGFIVPVGDCAALVAALVKVREKRVHLEPRVPQQTKDDYLRAYQHAWGTCAGLSRTEGL